MASQSYTSPYPKGRVISGLAEAGRLPDVKVFHSGTKRENEFVVTDAGRVLSVTALGDTLADAQHRTYEAVSLIHFHGAHYRRDIANRALAPANPFSDAS